MDATTPSEQERTEVELVLQSGVFDKAPRLGRFFRYICDRHFDGQADQIKEYSVALEALGRGADFDPKKDSIALMATKLRQLKANYAEARQAILESHGFDIDPSTNEPLAKSGAAAPGGVIKVSPEDMK